METLKINSTITITTEENIKTKTKVMKTTTTINEEIEVGDFICHQTKVDGVITDQYFTTKNPKETHFGYEPERMRFRYFGKNMLEEIEKFNRYDDKYFCDIYKYEIVDLDSFNDFNNLYCDWSSMDSNFYKIDYPYPLPTTHMISFWESYYDIDKLNEHLKNSQYMVDIVISNTPYYNLSICGKRELEFYFKPTKELIEKFGSKISHSSNYDNPLIINDVLDTEQFKKQEEDVPDDDDDDDF